MEHDLATRADEAILAVSPSGELSRRRTLAALAVLLALALACCAALLTGSDLSPVTLGVENASSSGSSFLRAVSIALPFGYAFGAGMVAAVNPCGFALLPAYLGLYLGDLSDDRATSRAPRIARALVVSAAVTSGFILLFGATGLVLGSLTGSLTRAFPWLGLIVGVVLVLLAGWAISSGGLYSGFGERLSGRLAGAARGRSVAGYFAYGIGYGLASLSCTLPIFLALAGGALTANRLASSLADYVMYALGMGFVISILTLAVALFKLAAVQRVRRLVRYVQPVSSVLLLIAGGYLVYYWLTLGGLLEKMR